MFAPLRRLMFWAQNLLCLPLLASTLKLTLNSEKSMDPYQPHTFAPEPSHPHEPQHHDHPNQQAHNDFIQPPMPSHHQQPFSGPSQPAFQSPVTTFAPTAPSQGVFVPQPQQPEASLAHGSPFDQAVQSKPVVKVLSPFGVEYVFLALSLFLGAAGLLSALLIIVNGNAGFSALAFPAAMLLVTVPIFAFLFLRLKKLEMRMPHLRLDASKRRTTQLIQILAFIAVIVGLITFVYSVFARMAGQSGTSVGKATLDLLCVLVVAGGILAYYWREEHVSKR